MTEFKPGVVADWRVELHVEDPAMRAQLAAAISSQPKPGSALLSFSRSDYFATLDVDAHVGLSSGGFTLELDRALPETHTKVVRAIRGSGDARAALLAKVYLGWADRHAFPLGPPVPAGGADGLTLVGVFVLTDSIPAVDGIRFRLTLQGRELFAHRLSARAVDEQKPAASAEEAAAALLKHFDFEESQYAIASDPSTPPASPPSGEERKRLVASPQIGKLGLEEMIHLGGRMEREANRHGRQPFLVRDEMLHIGVRRKVPFEGRAIRVSVASGLVGYRQTGTEPKDPNFNFDKKSLGHKDKSRSREKYSVRLNGAPWIKPGDVIAFVPADSELDSGSLARQLVPGAAAAAVEDWSHAIELYVASVVHRIEKNHGFFTTVTGVKVDLDGTAADAVWDVHSTAPEQQADRREDTGGDGTPEGALSAAVGRLVTRQLNREPGLDIGEVRSHEGDFPQSLDLLHFTSAVIRGLSSASPGANRSTHAPMFRAGQTPIPNTPYLTPFAWGNFGLVLPRYPGTRVMLAHRRRDADDPVDIGALWHQESENGESGGPAHAKMGDWWLILPAGVAPAAPNEPIENPIMPANDAKASNDLIDAAGARFIEVGQLIVRVGQAALKVADTRPKREAEPENAVVIEQKDGGARIVIDKDGGITIEAAKTLILKAGQDIELEAANVKVKVSGTMDVDKS